MTTTTRDPYTLHSDSIQEPPVKFVDKLKFLGPGFILSASIVGSGELIATTSLGAKAGFVTLWIIIISCLVKVMIQLEYGKHAIYSGETVMQSFNKLPGPTFGNANWTIWTWLVLMVTKLVQVGGIIGGVAIIVNMAVGTPKTLMPIWTFSIAIIVSILILRGRYQFIERFSIGMIGLFTLFTFACLFFIQFTDYAISFPQIMSGLSFQLPPEAVVFAIGAFGITGVGGDEIMFYNYWCLEKGYAAYTGPRTDDEAWEKRAKGWIKIMYLDAFLAMLVYTLMTAAFYLLGAAVLHARGDGDIPDGYDLVESLSVMYTETLGPWAKWVFLLGATIVLFSTLFGALASWIRIFTDAFGQLGWLDFNNLAERKRIYDILTWLFPFSWGILFLFIELPAQMVIAGGVITSIILFIVVFAGIHFRYKRLPESLKPGTWYDIGFWISTLAITWVGLYGVLQFIEKMNTLP